MRKPVFLYGLILLLALCLFGCTRSSEPVSGKQQAVLRVGYLPLTDHLTLMVADARKMFSAAKVELVKFTDWATLAEAVASRKIDGAHMLNTLGIKLVSNGYQGRTVVLSHRGDIALAARPDVQDVQALKGKTIAVPSRFSSHYFMLHNYLTKHGLVVDKDVNILDVPPPDFVSTMASGGVDAFVGSEPFPTIAEAKGIGKTLALWDEMEIEGLNGLDCVVVFREDLIASQPDLVQDYVGTIIAAGHFIEAQPAEAAALASPYMLNIDPQIIVKSIDEPRHRSSYDNLVPRADEYTRLQDYMLKIGSLQQGIDINAFVDDSFAVAVTQQAAAPPGQAE